MFHLKIFVVKNNRNSLHRTGADAGRHMIAPGKGMLLGHRRSPQSEMFEELYSWYINVPESAWLRQIKFQDNRKMRGLARSAGLEMGEQLDCHITVPVRVLRIRIRMGVDDGCAIDNVGMRKQAYSADVEYEQQRKECRDQYVPQLAHRMTAD